MMHQQIEDQEIIERYVRDQLGPEERKAFEEHFFACDACFKKLQATERFVAGIRDAASRGLLEDRPADYVHAPSSWRAWMFPALTASSCAAIALALVAGWTLLSKVPKLQKQLNQASADVNAQREAIAALQNQITSATHPEPNVPLVMLQATRDVQASVNEAVLPARAERLVLWVEVPLNKFRSFHLQVETEDHHPVVSLDHLVRNSYGALAVGLPSEQLQPGEFRIMLTGEEPPPASLLAEYKLRIRKP
jgi:putative zinc finger protein